MVPASTARRAARPAAAARRFHPEWVTSPHPASGKGNGFRPAPTVSIDSRKDRPTMTAVPRSTRQLASTTRYDTTRYDTTRYDPTREVEEIQDRLEQLLASAYGDPSTDSRRPPLSVPVDIEETDDQFIVELDLPNVAPEDVDVELNDNQLRVTGEIKRKERSGILRRQTRRVGEFEYVITLPGEIDPDRVDAALSEGVLSVRVGRANAGRARHIEVKGSRRPDGQV
jgi:HSP20 family protein